MDISLDTKQSHGKAYSSLDCAHAMGLSCIYIHCVCDSRCDLHIDLFLTHCVTGSCLRAAVLIVHDWLALSMSSV